MLSSSILSIVLKANFFLVFPEVDAIWHPAGVRSSVYFATGVSLRSTPATFWQASALLSIRLENLRTFYTEGENQTGN